MRLSRAHALRIALLADAKHLIGTLLESGTISLSGTQAKLLLLLGGTEGLPVALVHEAGNRLAGSQVLLTSQIGLRDTTTITAKRALRNLITQKAGLFLTLLLTQVSHSRTDHAIQIRGHILIDLLPTQRTCINGLSTGSSEASRHTLIWLCASLCLINSPCRSGVKRLRTSQTTHDSGSCGLIIRLRGRSGRIDIPCGITLKRLGRLPRLLETIQGSAAQGTANILRPSDVLSRLPIIRCGSTQASLGVLTSGLIVRLR